MPANLAKLSKLLTTTGIVLVLASLSACSSDQPSAPIIGATTPSVAANTDKVNIAGLIISNDTNATLNKIEVYIPKTNQRLSCGDIAQQRICDVKFSGERYNAIYISWVRQQKYRESRLLVIPETLLNQRKDNVFKVKINNLSQLEVGI